MQVASPTSSAYNSPFDSYSVHTFHGDGGLASMRTTFQLPNRYRLIRPIGQGAYGLVCSAEDILTGEMVAIKKIASVAHNAIDCKRTLREMKLLRHFNHENVIGLRDVYIPEQQSHDFEDVYTVSELMDSDLHQIITSQQQLTDEHCQYFSYQILRALKHIHSANVLHRDLKPSNILLNGNCDLKICDFGLARVQPQNQADLTAYVATRWYRAPEIMLSWREYTNAVDMWSVGCIIGEIILRQPLFPGNDYLQQLELITDVVGSPSPDDLSSITSVQVQNFVSRRLMGKPPKALESLFPEASPLLLDLLKRMLVFEPSRRITVDDALRHPYFESFQDEEEEEPPPPTSFEFEFDDDFSVSSDALKSMIWEEAQAYRRYHIQQFYAAQQYHHHGRHY